MDWKQQNIETYNKSAEALANYFAGYGARTDDIELGLSLAQVALGTGKVVEIGCGDGRDAEEIVARVGWYEGVDPSEGLLAIARRRLPETSFVIADALSYAYPENTDAIFAFASLLHVSKQELPAVLEKAHQSLRSGGILFLSLKEREAYEEEVKADTYGERLFYFYNPDIIAEMAQSLFSVAHVDHQVKGNTDWFTIALLKP